MSERQGYQRRRQLQALKELQGCAASSGTHSLLAYEAHADWWLKNREKFRFQATTDFYVIAANHR